MLCAESHGFRMSRVAKAGVQTWATKRTRREGNKRGSEVAGGKQDKHMSRWWTLQDGAPGALEALHERCMLRGVKCGFFVSGMPKASPTRLLRCGHGGRLGRGIRAWFFVDLVGPRMQQAKWVGQAKSKGTANDGGRRRLRTRVTCGAGPRGGVAYLARGKGRASCRGRGAEGVGGSWGEIIIWATPKAARPAVQRADGA